jgi:uncharacterized protein
VEEETRQELSATCIRILQAAGCDESVIAHCCAVADLALELAHRQPDRVDEELVYQGALLHDLGRARSQGIDHAVVGGELAREFGLDEKLVRIIERHIGAGIPAAEAKEVGLPAVDFMPETLEEKIVAHADNLIDGWRRTSLEHAIANLQAKMGEDHPAIERMRALHREVMGES